MTDGASKCIWFSDVNADRTNHVDRSESAHTSKKNVWHSMAFIAYPKASDAGIPKIGTYLKERSVIRVSPSRGDVASYEHTQAKQASEDKR